MNNYYFTFGSDVIFPYYKGYLIVKANTIEEACEKFQYKYSNVNDCLCCAFYYTQEEWDTIDDDMGRCHEVIQ